jgi:hypothetical protein
MEQYQIEANEHFFKKVIQYLKEGGVYAYPDAMETYTKEGAFLVGNAIALLKVKELVSPAFYNKYFNLKTNEI